MGTPTNPAQAALWTPAPFLADADPLELAKAAADSEAAVSGTELKKKSIKNLITLDQELRAEASEAYGKLKSSARWSSLGAFIGLGTVVLGATGFDLRLVPLGLAGIGKDLLPYLQERKTVKSGASWIYYSFQNPDQLT